jgi:GT2 family glycosyltransferase
LLARRTAVETIGLLDEALFAYFEDMDWCLRARRAGFDVVVAPRAHVRHVGGASTGPASTLTTYYSVRNHLIVSARYGGRRLMPLVLGYQLAYLARSPSRRTRGHLVAFARGARAGWSSTLEAGRQRADRS